MHIDRIIGHRGACGYAPENTIASMQKAHDLGIRWVEFDVMLAACNEPIIFHDLTLSRTTSGKGRIAKMPYAKIQKLDAGRWFSEEFANEHVPSLCELLLFLKKLKMNINVEIKPVPGFERETAYKTLELLDAFWPSQDFPPLLSSFSVTVLDAIREKNKEVALGYIINQWTTDWKETLNHYKCVSLHINHARLTADSVKSVKSMGYLLLAYTINEKQRAKKLFEWGVDSVFSDFPDLLMNHD